MKFKPLAAMLIVSLLAGCSEFHRPTQKEVAVKQWNAARASVLVSLAKSEFEAGNIDKSRETLNDALRLSPDSADVHVLSARIYIEQSQLEKAEQELQLARKFNDKDALADYLLGVIYQRWQKQEMAYECYLSASQKEPTELAYVLARAEMLVAMNCAPEAVAVLKSKLEYFEHNATLHDEIGQLLAAQGHYGEAVESLKHASMLAPEDLAIREHLAMAEYKNRQYREAGEAFQRLVTENSGAKRADLWLALGECQLQLGRSSDARNSLDNATQLDATSVPAWLSLAKASLQLGDPRRAERSLTKALALDSANAEAHLLMGYVHLREDRMNDAMIEFQKSSSLDSRDPVSLCMIGYVLEKTGKPQQAMKYYAQALKIKPDDELASKLMASVDVGN